MRRDVRRSDGRDAAARKRGRGGGRSASVRDGARRCRCRRATARRAWSSFACGPWGRLGFHPRFLRLPRGAKTRPSPPRSACDASMTRSRRRRCASGTSFPPLRRRNSLPPPRGGRRNSLPPPRGEKKLSPSLRGGGEKRRSGCGFRKGGRQTDAGCRADRDRYLRRNSIEIFVGNADGAYGEGLDRGRGGRG